MKIIIWMAVLFTLVTYKNISAKGDSAKVYSAVLKFDPSRNPAEDLKMLWLKLKDRTGE